MRRRYVDRLPSLHVLAGCRAGLCSALSIAFGPFAHVKPWGVVPSFRAVRAGDLIVVHLNDPLPGVEPSSLEVFVSKRATLYLVLSDTLIAPAWVEIASAPEVRVLRCGTSRGRVSYGGVVTELLERVRGPTGERIATLVLRTEPALRPVAPLVEMVCREPWRIRRPSDLAKWCAISLVELRRRCAEVGFARVEHFIICVRLVAYQQLVGAVPFPAATARLLAGFTDSSNLRRHTRRAARRSLPVAHVPESLHPAPRRPHFAPHGQEVACGG
jgi:hypothetical protein